MNRKERMQVLENNADSCVAWARKIRDDIQELRKEEAKSEKEKEEKEPQIGDVWQHNGFPARRCAIVVITKELVVGLDCGEGWRDSDGRALSYPLESFQEEWSLIERPPLEKNQVIRLRGSKCVFRCGRGPNKYGQYKIVGNFCLFERDQIIPIELPPSLQKEEK